MAVLIHLDGFVNRYKERHLRIEILFSDIKGY
jgi:hypothetical protein